MKGWIKLYRDIEDCYLWDDKPFNQGAAWVDLLIMANHKDTTIMFDKKPTRVNTGSLITSTHKLSDKWGWSRGKVTRFLNMLANENMIELDTDSKRTAITIVNYCKFQDVQTTDEPLTDQSRTTDEPLTNLNKNVKNIKNVKKKEKKIKREIFPDDPNLNDAFNNFVEMRKEIKAPMTERAIDLAVKKLETLSGGDSDLAIEILNQSIMNSWKGLFALKTERQTSSAIDWDSI